MPEATPPSDDAVILAQDLTPTEAHLLCASLRAGGIAADVGDAHITQTHSLLSVAVGGAKVRVPQSQVDAARALMAALQRGDMALGDDFDPGPAPRE